jgi:nucleoid-associated protein YgaU
MATTIDPLLLGLSSPRGRSVAQPARRRPSEATFRRRRRMVGATVVFAVASVVVTSGAFASNPSPAEQVVPRTVIAQNGDTLWDIARTIVPQGSVADLVSEMVRLNGSHIEPGQVIRIP